MHTGHHYSACFRGNHWNVQFYILVRFGSRTISIKLCRKLNSDSSMIYFFSTALEKQYSELVVRTKISFLQIAGVVEMSPSS